MRELTALEKEIAYAAFEAGWSASRDRDGIHSLQWYEAQYVKNTKIKED